MSSQAIKEKKIMKACNFIQPTDPPNFLLATRQVSQSL